MNLVFAPNAAKQRQKLRKEINRKFFKQLTFLLKDPRHPSLRARKKSGEDLYEARIDKQYRFCYSLVNDQITILLVGPHDEGLGKK